MNEEVTIQTILQPVFSFLGEDALNTPKGIQFSNWLTVIYHNRGSSRSMINLMKSAAHAIDDSMVYCTMNEDGEISEIKGPSISFHWITKFSPEVLVISVTVAFTDDMNRLDSGHFKEDAETDEMFSEEGIETGRNRFKDGKQALIAVKTLLAMGESPEKLRENLKEIG